MPANNYQMEVQVAAYLASLARQRASLMERAAEAGEALVTHLREQNQLLKEQIALLQERRDYLDDYACEVPDAATNA